MSSRLFAYARDTFISAARLFFTGINLIQEIVLSISMLLLILKIWVQKNLEENSLEIYKSLIPVQLTLSSKK
jgi:hypothetical protein